METLLVTGFEPFGGMEVNASWEAASRLPEFVGRWKIECLRLPVVYQAAGDALLDACARIHPAAVMMLGLAAGRTDVTPERRAVNRREAPIADNAGRLCQGEAIDPDGPAEWITRAPVDAMAEAVRETGVPSSVSESAGTYVCNDLYYLFLHSPAAKSVPGVFIHLPSGQTYGALAEALTACIRTWQAEAPCNPSAS